VNIVVKVFLLFLLAVCGACASRQVDTNRLPVEPFVGHVTTTDDGSWFTPCGAAATERWWVTYVDTSVRQARDAKAKGLLAPGQRTFVRWRASRTDERLVGPGGPALLVRDIFEIRAPADGDCRRPAV
jgi:hypothetical protein